MVVQVADARALETVDGVESVGKALVVVDGRTTTKDEGVDGDVRRRRPDEADELQQDETTLTVHRVTEQPQHSSQHSSQQS